MIDDVIRYAVAVTLTAVLVLMAVRWRAWAAASEMWRLLAVALGVLTLSVLFGTLAGIQRESHGRTDRPVRARAPARHAPPRQGQQHTPGGRHLPPHHHYGGLNHEHSRYWPRPEERRH